MDDWDVSPEPDPTDPHGDGVIEELKAMLPSEFRGTVLYKYGASGEHLVGERDELVDVFGQLMDVLSILPEHYAFAVAVGETDGTPVQVGVMRVQAIEGERLLSTLVELGRARYPDTGIEPTTIDDRSVTQVVTPADNEDHGPAYLHASGEQVFWVQTADRTLVGEGFALLP